MVHVVVQSLTLCLDDNIRGRGWEVKKRERAGKEGEGEGELAPFKAFQLRVDLVD